jgi:methylase of polypeptide subunit release factors
VPPTADSANALEGAPGLSPWELPINDASDEVYAAVRSACANAGFTEAALCRRFGLASIVDFKSLREGRPERARHGDAVEVLTDLFLDLVGVSEAQARRLLGDEAVQAMLALRLVRASASSEPHLLATVLMYPTAGVLLASDRTFARPGEELALPADIVYPAITRNTDMFVRMMPRSSCEAFLEMCAGTGIAAMAMASRVGHSWSLDIAARSTVVARFNARLNGLSNVTVLQGDLYEPVRGLTFDRIVAHPPYVPSMNQQIIYRDGGPDGEFITRRLVTELPQYLRPGGRFYATCVVTDRANAPFEARVREWLGDAQAEFDVLVSVTSAEHPSEYYFKSAINGKRTFADAEQHHEALKALKVEQMVYCSWILERHASKREPVTARLRRGSTTTGRELEQYCDWLTRRSAPDPSQRMLSAYPRLDPSARLRHTQGVVGDKWTTTQVEIETTWPFAATLACPDDVAQMLARCDGSRTLKQLITMLRQKGFLKVSVTDQAVMQIVSSCVAAGALHLEDAERRGK